MRKIRLNKIAAYVIIIILFLAAANIYAQSSDKEAYDKAGDYINKGMIDAALVEVDKAIQINPGYAEAYFRRGIINFDKNNLNQAILDYSKSIELNPNNVDAYCQRALVYETSALYNEAISDYDKALRIKPEYTWALIKKAGLCDKVGNFSEALEAYKKFVPLAEKEDSLSTKPLNPGWTFSIKDAKKRIAEIENTSK